MATKKRTPVRQALRQDSSLQAHVADGLGAVKPAHRDHLDADIRGHFEDSLDLDEAMRPLHQQANRWDYLLGHGPSGTVVAVEPHSAKQDEITTVIAKRASAREQLKAHLREGTTIVKWLWVASGKVHFADTERARRRLDQDGIEFVSTKVMAKHLPRSPSEKPNKAAPASKPRRGTTTAR